MEEECLSAGEATEVAQRHAAFFLALAEEAEPWLRRSERFAWMARRQLTTGLRLAAALADVWSHSGHAGEGREWLGRLLERANGSGPTAVRAKALAREMGDRRLMASAISNQGRLAEFEGDFSGARAHLEKARSLYLEFGAEEALGGILYGLGSIAQREGRLEEAQEQYEQSLAMTSALPGGDQSCCLRESASMARLLGDYAVAYALGQRENS